MKEVTIYSSTSWNHSTKHGKYYAALEYKGYYKYISGKERNTTPDRCILIGFLQAIHLITEPCKIALVTATHFSFKRSGDPRGCNKDLKGLLLDIANDKKCEITINEWHCGGKKLKEKLFDIEKIAQKVNPIDLFEVYKISEKTDEVLEFAIN